MFDSSFFDTVYDRKNTGAIKYGVHSVGRASPVIPMWIADMDFKSPPAVTDALINAAQHGIYGYGDTDEEYDELIINWYEHRIGFRIEKEQILKVPGVIFGVAAAIRAMSEPDDSVLICQPVYYPFAEIIPGNHRKTVVSELILKDGRYEIDFDDFENKIRQNNVKVFLLCSPHNPVGRVWSKEELTQIAEICRRYDVYIISDEIHSDFIYPGYKHTPIASLSDEVADRTVTCLSPTKTFNLAGLQAANIIVPNKTLRKRIRKECVATGYSHLNIMAVAATKAAYRDGEEWLDGLLQYLQQNIALIKSAFPEHAPVSALNMEGTYLAWLDCRKLNLPFSELDDLFLNKAGVRLHNGNTFGAGGQGFMRMNIACPSSVLEEAVERIKSAVYSLRSVKI
ncbi:MAG: pyridoxal phosphate-dependent aminotransferase [Clostridia bacterium]|nr:pyridoxal phosphate-dependent aminotransferase [Clostridia bacterium]